MPREMQALAVDRSTREPPTGMGPMARIMSRYLRTTTAGRQQNNQGRMGMLTRVKMYILLLGVGLFARELLLEVVGDVGEFGGINAVLKRVAVVEVLEQLGDGELGGLESGEGDDPAETQEQDFEHDAEGSDGERCFTSSVWLWRITSDGSQTTRTLFRNEDDALFVEIDVVQALFSQAAGGRAVDLNGGGRQIGSELANLAVEEAVCGHIAPGKCKCGGAK